MHVSAQLRQWFPVDAPQAPVVDVQMPLAQSVSTRQADGTHWFAGMSCEGWGM
jgi:hypothetical protein